MKLIVGLGNIGEEYKNTRHNIGFKVIDAFLKNIDVSLNKEKFNGLFYKDKDFIIAKPNTYMNLSGDFVQAITSFFKIEIKDILVIHDDMDMAFGKAMMKPQGGHGGQNGMKDIQAKLGSKDISRIKIGIGRGKDPISHVLGKFSKSELGKVNSIMPKLIKGIKIWLNGDMNKAMINVNTK